MNQDEDLRDDKKDRTSETERSEEMRKRTNQTTQNQTHQPHCSQDARVLSTFSSLILLTATKTSLMLVVSVKVSFRDTRTLLPYTQNINVALLTDPQRLVETAIKQKRW